MFCFLGNFFVKLILLEKSFLAYTSNSPPCANLCLSDKVISGKIKKVNENWPDSYQKFKTLKTA